MKLTSLTKAMRFSIGASLLLTASMPVMAQSQYAESTNPITPYVYLVFVAIGIVNIVLFFKIWKMTNTVEKIFNLSLAKSGYRHLAPEDNLNRKIIFVKKE